MLYRLFTVCILSATKKSHSDPVSETKTVEMEVFFLNCPLKRKMWTHLIYPCFTIWTTISVFNPLTSAFKYRCFILRKLFQGPYINIHRHLSQKSACAIFQRRQDHATTCTCNHKYVTLK